MPDGPLPQSTNSAAPALDPADQRQLDRVLALTHQVLQAEAVGAYLFGSAVQGGLRPESDLDLLVVSRRPTTRTEKERLVHGLLPISGKSTPEGTWRRVELTIVVEQDVKPWRYPPVLDFQYGDWLRGDFEKGEFEPLPTPLRPDLALLITMAVAADAAQFGPPPSVVFDPIPPQDVLRAMLSDLHKLRADLGADTRNVILTLARIWSTFATGAIRSKDSAADWALPRLPADLRQPLERARLIYLGSEPERWDDLGDSIARCADRMITEIRRLAARGLVQA